jgi:hypothetical protein
MQQAANDNTSIPSREDVWKPLERAAHELVCSAFMAMGYVSERAEANGIMAFKSVMLRDTIYLDAQGCAYLLTENGFQKQSIQDTLFILHKIVSAETEQYLEKV